MPETALPTGQQPAALPALSNLEAPRGIAAGMSHVFSMADETASQSANWDGSLLTLSQAQLAWSILGLNIGEEAPTSLELAGVLNGMYVAVSDYDNGSWKYIGSELSEPAELDLTGGGYTSPSGSIYFALIAPVGAHCQMNTTFRYGLLTKDVTPPVWTDGEGILSVDASLYPAELHWHEATDSESAPVTYLIYQYASASGIDWEQPTHEVPGDLLSTGIGIPNESTEPFDYAVRARDAVGNVTGNTNFITATFSDRFEERIYDWQPGDRLELSWTDPQQDSALRLLAQNFNEGSPDEPEGLDGRITFSADSAVSGEASESATLLPTAWNGGYLLELHWDGGETYRVRLYDAADNLKQDLGNYTPTPAAFGGAIDYCYLRYDPQSWPQSGQWQPGWRLQIDWDDPNLNLDLWVESPGHLYGGPGWSEELDGLMTFSDESNTVGASTEWIGFTELSEPGEYEFILDWWETLPPLPESIELTWTVFDEADQPVLGPGTFTLYNSGEEVNLSEVWPLAWLNGSP
ncbi:MAG: hypothetical protein R3F46_00975 [bacterium]